MTTNHELRQPAGLKRPVTATSKRRKGRRRVDFGQALGASRSFAVGQKPDGPFGVGALVDEIKTRLVSRGGRPADSGSTIRRLVPLRKSVWSSLKAQAQSLSRHGKRVSPAQLAAMLVEKSLSELGTGK